MKIITKLVKGRDLEPGDLFSAEGDAYWQHRNLESIGERVFIRTETPLPPAEKGKDIYQIIIQKGGETLSSAKMSDNILG